MPPYRNDRYRYGSATSPYYRGSRVAKKRERPLPVAYRRPVASIAKRVISHLTEKKHLNINRDDLVVASQIYYYLDPMQFMTVGTGDGQRIGSKISDCWLHLSFQYNHNSTLWGGANVRIVVVRAEQQLPNAASAWQSSVASATVFPNLFTNDFQLSNAFPIGHDYTILADKVVSAKRDYTSANYGPPGIRKFRVKLGNMTYENTSVSGVNYQKGRNVYVIVGVCNAGTAVTDAMGMLQFSGMLTWRDA